MKYETFPLTAAEKLHLLAVQEFSSQVVNIGVCMSLKASLDFGLLKKCIQMEYQRNDSLRLRFTEPDPDGEPIFTSITGPGKLEASRKRHNDPTLRASDRQMNDLSVGQRSFFLEPEPTRQLLDFCMINNVSMTNLFLMGLRTYLSKVNNGEPDISVKNYVSRRTSRVSRYSGGTRVHCFPCRTILSPDTEFIDGILKIQCLQNDVYRHANYDSTKAVKHYFDAYHTPPKMTYESVALTYQPLPIRLQNENLANIPYQTSWFTNGTAIQELYLTVMHNATDLGLEFYFKYQLAEVSDHDVELLYYYLMRILFMGIKNPEMSIGEIIERV